MNINKKKWLRLLLLSGITASSLLLGGLVVFVYQVYFGDTSALEKTTIMTKINEESGIFYDDEKTRIGSFFENQHRRYVTIDEIPVTVPQAFIAIEDKYFYEHRGVNPIAILQAVAEGIYDTLKSGFKRIHFRGGSTITQQTVKNILHRRDYSISRKVREAIAAMQIERLYNKNQILEFYLNQFHVASNGTGIAIASKYYFDKEVKDLDLVESAFIAGSVKAPNYYNPFNKYSTVEKETAWSHANARKNLVLKAMYQQDFITEEQLKEAWDKPVPFRKGSFSTQKVSLVHLIRSQLEKKEILDALGLESIQELNSAGLKVYTTLDARMQSKAQLMVRRNLSKLESSLSDFAVEDAEEYRPQRDLQVDEFYFGKVDKIVPSSNNPREVSIMMDFGLAKGVIPYESVVRMAKLHELSVETGLEKRIKSILAAIKPGSVLFVEVFEYDPTTHFATVELRRSPEVNGALISLDRGNVKAIVSGFDASGYNRAIFGKRQPGSVFKTVTYFAAFQLGWNLLDLINNERRLFNYQGQFYYPRPDHVSPYKNNSIIWSGVKSENLATVFLTTHLLDKLNLEQFLRLLEHLGLGQDSNENESLYQRRLQKVIGVGLDNDGVREHFLQSVIEQVSADLVFSPRSIEAQKLNTLWYGRGYLQEIKRLYEEDLAKVDLGEWKIRMDLLKNNYQRLFIMSQHLRADWMMLEKYVRGGTSEMSDAETADILSRFRVVSTMGAKPRIAYLKSLPGETPPPISALPPEVRRFPLSQLETPIGRPVNRIDLENIFPPDGQNTWGDSEANEGYSIDDVMLQGSVSVGLFNEIYDQLERRTTLAMQEMAQDSSLRLFYHHDFRIGLGLHYLKLLCEQMGVFSTIDPVMSFPLGTNVMSVAEVAKVYQTFTEGKVYRFYQEGPTNQLNFIKRIEDRDGNILLQPEREEISIASPSVVEQTKQLLYRVVTHGTGSRARGELFLNPPVTGDSSRNHFIRIPAFGKTGTTNDYQTSSFAGFIPYPTHLGASPDTRYAYTIASYVGYDLNKSMVRGRLKVSGSSGALPIWTDFAKAVITDEDYVSKIDTNDLTMLSRKEWVVPPAANAVGVTVDLAMGQVLSGQSQDETFSMTNLDKTGEEFVNEFAPTAKQQTRLFVPNNVLESRNSVRKPISFFNYISKEEAMQETGDYVDEPAD